MVTRKTAFTLCTIGIVTTVALSLTIFSASQFHSMNSRGKEIHVAQLSQGVALLNVSSGNFSIFLSGLGANQILMAVLSTTSATFMSILVAASSFMRSEQTAALERYDKCHTKYRRLVHAVTYRHYRPGEPVILPVGNDGDIGDIHYEWQMHMYRNILEEEVRKPSAAEIFNTILSFDIPFDFELSDLVRPEEEELMNLEDERQLRELVNQMRFGVAYVRLRRRFRDGTLTIQSSFLTRYPSIITNIRRTLDLLINGILLYGVSLIFSIAWIVSVQSLLAIVSLLAYSGGLCLILRVVLGFRSLLRTR